MKKILIILTSLFCINYSQAETIKEFNVNKTEIHLGESLSFYWNADENTTLILYGGAIPSMGEDVTGMSRANDIPRIIGINRYRLSSRTESKILNVKVLPPLKN